MMQYIEMPTGGYEVEPDSLYCTLTRYMDGMMEREREGWRDGWMEICREGWMDEMKEGCIYVFVFFTHTHARACARRRSRPWRNQPITCACPTA